MNELKLPFKHEQRICNNGKKITLVLSAWETKTAWEINKHIVKSTSRDRILKVSQFRTEFLPLLTTD